MKNIVFITIAIVAGACCAPAQITSTSDNKTAEQEVRHAIKEYRAALMQHDAQALQRIWADNYTFINGTGALLTKADRLANLKSRATSFDSINEEEDIKVRVYGGDAAVAISRVTIKGQYSGQKTSGQFRSSHVWVRTASGWQLVSNQLTPVSSP